MSNKPGRNDPCPCGSGKKYKVCHALNDKQTSRTGLDRSRAITQMNGPIVDAMTRFARLRFGPDWDHPKWLPGIDETQPGAEQFFGPWLFLHTVRDGVTIAQAFLADRGAKLEPRQRGWIEAQMSASYRIYDITRVEPGHGLQIMDLATGDERFVVEVAGSSNIDVHTGVLARAIDFDGITVFCGIHPRPLTPEFTDFALREWKRDLKVRTKRIPPQKMDSLEGQSLLVEVWEDAVNAMDDRPLPTLNNTDGEAFVLTKDMFEVNGTVADIVRALVDIPGASEPMVDDDATVVTFTKPGNRNVASFPNTIVGTAIVKIGRLTLETNSLTRADLLKPLVEHACGALLRYRTRQVEDPFSKISHMPTREPVETPVELREVLRAEKNKYYKAWLDVPIPALGDRTPREVAKADARAKGRLVTLLKELEQLEARLPSYERADIGALRRELGL